MSRFGYEKRKLGVESGVVCRIEKPNQRRSLMWLQFRQENTITLFT